MLRVAIVDGNRRVEEYRALLPRLPVLKIAAIVDADESRARSAASALGAEVSARSISDLLKRYDRCVDAVLVHAMIDSRCAIVCRAAEAGLHAIVDSPMARTVEEADAMLASCTSAGVVLMVGESRRFGPAQQHIQNKLASGCLGTPGLVRIHNWNAVCDETGEQPAHDSTAALFPQLIREIDLACWLFNCMPTTVYAIRPSMPGSESRHYIQIHAGFPGGGMALIDCSLGGESNSNPYYSLSVIGSAGAAHADDHHNAQLWFHDGTTTALMAGHEPQLLLPMLHEFVDAIRAHRQPMSSGHDGRRALAVAHAVFNSLAAERATSLAGVPHELR